VAQTTTDFFTIAAFVNFGGFAKQNYQSRNSPGILKHSINRPSLSGHEKM